MINDSTFELSKHRPLNKTVLLTNSFSKFAWALAASFRSEEDCLNKLTEHCNANLFLFVWLRLALLGSRG